MYHSSVASGLIYDSNVFSSGVAESDRIFMVRPSFSVSTLDPNYKFTFRSFLESLEYERLDSENRTDYRAELDGKIRIQRDLDLAIMANAGRVNEPRSLQRRDIPTDAAEPVAYNQYATSAALIYHASRLVTTTTLAYENANYFDVRANGGGSLNLQFLDRDTVRVQQEEELRLSHRLRLFSRQAVIASDYRNVVGFVQRDSMKFDTSSGVEVGITPLLKARFSFRFAEEHFDDPTISADPELNYRSEIVWSVLRNVRLRAGVAREFGGVNFDLDSSGGRRTRVDFGVDYDISSRLFLRGTINYLHANEASITLGTSRVEDTYQYRLALAYQLDRYWSLFADYAYEQRQSESGLDEFERNVVQVGAVARF